MAETWQPIIGNPEPLWSFVETKRAATKVRAMAELHPGISKELIETAVLIEHLAQCTNYYRNRWIEAQWNEHEMRNLPRDAEKARQNEDR
jgi:septation ring formation regulator EzrA